MGLEHDPQGEICKRCGKPAEWHSGRRVRPSRRLYHRVYERSHPKPKAQARIIGIDGEGSGRFPHLYNFLAAADEFGQTWQLGRGPKVRITTEEFLDFILELPLRSLIFAFAFLYDLTKGLTDLPDKMLFLLFHEKRRQFITERGTPKERMIYRPVYWPSRKAFKDGTGYRLNYMNRKFSVAKGKRAATVWDVFAFFQSKFTKACADWKIANEADLDQMERMKAQRSKFDRQSYGEIGDYCLTECKNLAKLGRGLLDAHTEAGFPLTDYYGAGSTAKALMNKHNVRDYIASPPDEMREAVACAFFGGRFENSVIGPIRRKVWNADISSAYPYAATFLPCLTHGRWRKIMMGHGLERAVEESRLALIRWHLPKLSPSVAGLKPGISSWGPLPVRKLDGTIAFPLGAYCGWTWKEEFLQASKLRLDVHASCAWVYDSDCSCQPFKFLPEVYLERLRIGKEAKGIVLKLGPNSVYGKTVQSLGWKPPFQSFVWGGNITSNCRAQLLEGMALAPSLENVLMLATDGLWTDCPIQLPSPRDTGTSHVAKPLGGWEVKEYDKGVFAARPGIYFPMDPTEEEIGKIRARGLGRRVLYEQYRMALDAYERGEGTVTLGAPYCDVAAHRECGPRCDCERGTQRFFGAKTGIKWSKATGVRRDDNYGEWVSWPTEINFNPKPKRKRIIDRGRLECWGIEEFALPSIAYDPAIKTDEDKLLELAELIAEEQNDADFVEV